MAELNDFLKRDIAHIGDLKKKATGDLDTLEGLRNVKNALFHRLMTRPGTLAHRPEYGVGLQDYQNGINSLSKQRQLALRIQTQFEQDPRVESVQSVAVDGYEDQPDLVKLIVRVQIRGYGENTLTFTPFGEGV